MNSQKMLNMYENLKTFSKNFKNASKTNEFIIKKLLLK